MSGMHERREGMDAKMANDSEFRFKVSSRRNRLVARWAGGLLGKSADEIKDYEAEVIKADFEEAGAEDVFRKLSADLAAGGVEKTEVEIRHAMAEKMDEALEHAMGG